MCEVVRSSFPIDLRVGVGVVGEDVVVLSSLHSMAERRHVFASQLYYDCITVLSILLKYDKKVSTCHVCTFIFKTEKM